MLNKYLKKIIFLLFIVPFSNLYALEFDGSFIQGHFIIGKTDPKTMIWIDKKKIKVSKDGYFVFGIGRDRKYDVVITSLKGGKKTKIVKKIKKRKYQIQRIDGLDEKKVASDFCQGCKTNDLNDKIVVLTNNLVKQINKIAKGFVIPPVKYNNKDN